MLFLIDNLNLDKESKALIQIAAKIMVNNLIDIEKTMKL
jgi:hypothetical protein